LFFIELLTGRVLDSDILFPKSSYNMAFILPQGFGQSRPPEKLSIQIFKVLALPLF